MTQVKARRRLRRTSIEFRAFWGKNHQDNYYVLIKARKVKGNFFQVFTATELKGACIDILGLPDNPKTRKTNAKVLARRVWNERTEQL